jgi:HSP20 family protein
MRPLGRLFEDLLEGFDLSPEWVTRTDLGDFTPRLNVRETEDEIVVTAELPGVEEKDFEVSLEADVLTIKGEKRTEHEEEHEGFRHVETRSGRFERRLVLPSEVEEDKVKATYKNGVVTVTLPKVAEPRPEVHAIPINSA